MFKASKDAFERNVSSYLAGPSVVNSTWSPCAPYTYTFRVAPKPQRLHARDKISTRVHATLFYLSRIVLIMFVCVFRIPHKSTCIISHPAFLRTSFLLPPRFL